MMAGEFAKTKMHSPAHEADPCINRNGWGVTAIDALSTAIIMRDFFTVKQILDFVPKIDFTTTKVANEGISVFETNIRYLGGLISGKKATYMPPVAVRPLTRTSL